MNEHESESQIEIADAAELFSKLPVASQDAIIALLKSLLSEQ